MRERNTALCEFTIKTLEPDSKKYSKIMLYNASNTLLLLKQQKAYAVAKRSYEEEAMLRSICKRIIFKNRYKITLKADLTALNHLTNIKISFLGSSIIKCIK